MKIVICVVKERNNRERERERKGVAASVSKCVKIMATLRNTVHPRIEILIGRTIDSVHETKLKTKNLQLGFFFIELIFIFFSFI